MQRYLPPILTLAVLTIAAVVLTVTVGAQGGGPSRESAKDAADHPGGAVAGMCVEGVPDCVDTIVVGDDEHPDGYGCSADVCVDPPPVCSSEVDGRCVDEKPPVPPDGSTGPNPCPPDFAACESIAYAVAIDFTVAYTQEDLDIAEKLLQGFDPDVQFLLLETFPPMGRATLATSDGAFCELLQAKLLGRAGIGRIGCEPAQPPVPGAPDDPVSSTPDTRR